VGYAAAAPDRRPDRRVRATGAPPRRRTRDASAEMPPLSWTLRDSPLRPLAARRRLTPSVSGGLSRARPPLSRAPWPPPPFCLRVSGAVAPSAPHPLRPGRDLSCGRAFGAACLHLRQSDVTPADGWPQAQRRDVSRSDATDEHDTARTGESGSRRAGLHLSATDGTGPYLRRELPDPRDRRLGRALSARPRRAGRLSGLQP